MPDLVDDGEVTDSVVEEALTTRNLDDLDETIYSDNPNLLDADEKKPGRVVEEVETDQSDGMGAENDPFDAQDQETN